MSQDLTYSGGKVRLFVGADLAADRRVEIQESQAHYLVHVMRARVGDHVRLFNGRDGEWLASVRDVGRHTALLVCGQQLAPQIDTPDVWLAFAPVKRTPADYIAQKATELGVRVLQPVITRRTIVSRVNLERVRANAVEAAEQSGRVSVPEVRPPRQLPLLLKDWDPSRTLVFCDESGVAKPIADALVNRADGPCAILAGPEGGFDPEERSLLREFPFVLPVSLGARILRADTAALAALAIWQALRGDWTER